MLKEYKGEFKPSNIMFNIFTKKTDLLVIINP